MTGLGKNVAGLLGEAAQSLGELEIFGGIAAFTILFGVLVIVFLDKLIALTHGAEDQIAEIQPDTGGDHAVLEDEGYSRPDKA